MFTVVARNQNDIATEAWYEIIHKKQSRFYILEPA